jgi:hypothetical protein
MKVNLPQLPPRCPPFVYGEVKEVLAADGTLDGEFVDPKTAYTVIKELKVRPKFYEGQKVFLNKNVEKTFLLSQQLKLCCLPGYTAGYVISKINVLKY